MAGADLSRHDITGRAMPEEPKLSALSVYWASSCGGCEMALVNLHEKILDVAELF
jgi:F420-non-reducing hydrogenase small subunit